MPFDTFMPERTLVEGLLRARVVSDPWDSQLGKPSSSEIA